MNEALVNMLLDVFELGMWEIAVIGLIVIINVLLIIATVILDQYQFMLHKRSRNLNKVGAVQSDQRNREQSPIRW